jgi:hypothetical protein
VRATMSLPGHFDRARPGARLRPFEGISEHRVPSTISQVDEHAQDVISNSRALIEAMGSWPSFHDAKLLKASRVGVDCQVVVHVFEMTSEVDTAGYFVLIKHHLVTLDMLGVVRCDLPDDYDGDILDAIEARRCDDGTAVEFESVIDPERSWRVVCREVLISDVAPCDSDGRAI